MKIAIVEDEPKLAKVLQDYLHKDGYETVMYNDGQDALDGLLASSPDLLLLDLMLPTLDGMTICKELRKTSHLPIIMLTAKVEEIDRLLGLEIGADDYICKPFSPREVIARVKAVLRRTKTLSANDLGKNHVDQYAQPAFTLDELTATVHIKGNITSLTAVELRLLQVLYERPGQIFNRSQLMHRIYQDNRVVSDRTIDSHIKKLRQKIESLDNAMTYIHSVYGIGYKFEALEKVS